MQKLLPLLCCLLMACTDNSVRELNEFAHSDGVKQIAKIGEDLITIPTHQPPQASHDANADTELVYRRGQVGHRDFKHAKQVLPQLFTGELQEEFYCGCQYTGKTIDLDSCGYVPRKNKERASRLEWEHVVSAWAIGHQRQCWQQGGRKNCTSSDVAFQVAEGDLHNLVPSIGEVNGDRSNFAYGAWTRNPTPMYGQCQTIVDFKQKRAQPRTEVRGLIARTTIYMHDRYDLAMSRQDRQLMCAWAKTYPADKNELRRDQRIAALQGNSNRYVTDPGAVEKYCAGKG